MHVLTKIFIVLVSLLTVVLVPLVVTYAHNENSYQARFQQAQAQADAAKAELKTAQASFGAAETKKNSQIQEQTNLNFQLQKTLDESERQLRKIEADLADASSMDKDIRAQLATLSSAVEASQNLNSSLIDELRGTRQDALMSQRQRVELDEALRDAQARLDVAEEARRGLEEELQRLKDEYSGALAEVQQYYARFGELNRETLLGSTGGVPIDRDIDCHVVNVRRTGDQTLASIDAGSLDGVKVGWVVPIGGTEGYVASLRITTVDINRSVGVVELATEDRRVQVGDRVPIRANVGR